MKNSLEMNPGANPDESPDAATGIPGLRSWKRVYIAVLASLFFWIALLGLLTASFP